VAVFAGVIYGVSYAIGQINEGVQSTKEACVSFHPVSALPS
jgi:hypothetical protein